MPGRGRGRSRGGGGNDGGGGGGGGGDSRSSEEAHPKGTDDLVIDGQGGDNTTSLRGRTHSLYCILEGVKEYAVMKKYCILGFLIFVTLATSAANVYLQDASPAVLRQELERVAGVAQSAAAAAVSGNINQLLRGETSRVHNGTGMMADFIREYVLDLVLKGLHNSSLAA